MLVKEEFIACGIQFAGSLSLICLLCMSSPNEATMEWNIQKKKAFAKTGNQSSESTTFLQFHGSGHPKGHVNFKKSSKNIEMPNSLRHTKDDLNPSTCSP